MGCCESQTPGPAYEPADEDVPTVQCVMCMGETEREDMGVVLPCGHSAFHEHCIMKWLTGTESACPVCKQQVLSCNGHAIAAKKQAVAKDYDEEMRPEVEGEPPPPPPPEPDEPHPPSYPPPPDPPRYTTTQPSLVPFVRRPDLRDLKLPPKAENALFAFTGNFQGSYHANPALSHTLLLTGAGAEQNPQLPRTLWDMMRRYEVIVLTSDWQHEKRDVQRNLLFWMDRLPARVKSDDEVTRLADFAATMRMRDCVFIATAEKTTALPRTLMRAFETVVRVA